MNNPQTKRWRRLRRCLVGLGVCVTLIGLFYTEELWRGKRAWENCKSALEAKGVDLNWADYIPAPVPDNENVFGVPEMQKWFVEGGVTELSRKLGYAGSTARLTVAELTIGLPGAGISSSSGAAVLQWGDAQANVEAARLIKDALGPMVMAPAGFNIMLRQPEEIRPAQIFLQCQAAPTKKELLQFLPFPIANTYVPRNEEIQVEPSGNVSYKVTMVAPDTVAEYLKRSEQFEPEFTLILNALQRPFARMDGGYSVPAEIPVPNFVAMRTLSQRLGAMAQCHLLQSRPEEALRDLALINDICLRILKDNKPMTLVSAMVNVAIKGLCVGIITDGMRLQAWREPQLAALQEQLKQINLLPMVRQAFETLQVSSCYLMEAAPPVRMTDLLFDVRHDRKVDSWTAMKHSVIGGFFPRGWAYQNAVTCVNLYPDLIAGIDPGGQIVFPEKASAAAKDADAIFRQWSPYNFIAARMFPNFTKACQTTARNQTMVNQALIVCALERCHLARGEYPETLDALIPQFIDKIPRDVVGGQPPHYRRAVDGTFILYSIGWSGRDNGGVRGKSIATGDWVWPAI